MKKSVLVIFVAMALLAMPGWVFAGGCSGSGCSQNGQNNNSNDQGQSQGQTMIFAPQSNGNTSIGQLPQTPGYEQGMAMFPANSYGHQVNEMSVYNSVLAIPEITRSAFCAYKQDLINRQIWESFEKRIVVRVIPRIRYTPTGVLYFAKNIPPQLASRAYFVGITAAYARKDQKEDLTLPVLVPDLQMFSAEASMNVGANLAVPIGQAYAQYFTAKGNGFSISGIMSALAAGGGIPFGGAIGPQMGFSNGTNYMTGDAGVSFALLYVPGLNQSMLVQPVAPTTQVAALQSTERIARCVLPGPHNVNLRIDDAALDIRNYNQRHDLRDLRLSRDTLVLAIRMDRASGQQLRTVYEMLASVNLELARVTSGFDREHYQRLAIKYASRAGLSTIRTINEY
jgi:hypothetical protein